MLYRGEEKGQVRRKQKRLLQRMRGNIFADKNMDRHHFLKADVDAGFKVTVKIPSVA